MDRQIGRPAQWSAHADFNYVYDFPTSKYTAYKREHETNPASVVEAEFEIPRFSHPLWNFVAAVGWFLYRPLARSASIYTQPDPRVIPAADLHEFKDAPASGLMVL